MKYLAILGYDCGCVIESNPGFIKTITFYGNPSEKLEYFKKRKSKSREGHQCRRSGPIEVLILDEQFKEIKKWRKNG